MVDSLIDKVREYITPVEGRIIEISHVRKELKIDPKSPAWEGLRVVFHRLVEEKKLSPSGKKDGSYKVVRQVKPVRVFEPNRERRPQFDLVFPRAFDTQVQMDFAGDVVIREGDLITLGGVKSKGKTLVCLSFCAENIELRPVLMGNEYTVEVEDKENKGQMKFEPAPRFFNRLSDMDWVKWVDAEGDKFTLLPVREDYAEHIVKDKINIIDWVNIDGEHLYDIGKILEGIKRQLGRGIAIVALQKGEGATNPRGGQFVRDFSDLEILLDGFGDCDDDIMLTIKGCKEKHSPIVGKTYAYSIGANGTQIFNFREVKKCVKCHATGYTKGAYGSNVKCETCNATKYISTTQEYSESCEVSE